MANKIEISMHGNLLMYHPSYSAEFIEETIRARNLNGLRIFDFWEPLDSLDFLRGFSFLKWLEITCRYDQEFSFLEDLPQLEHLSIGPSAKMENEIDLSHQKNLQYLSIQWRKNRIKGLDPCRKLKDLCLIEFSCENLKIIDRQKELLRIRVKTGAMSSIEGVEDLSNLDSLAIGNCRRLRSISSLNGLEKLRSIEIESCRKIEDFEMLTDLPAIESIRVINCGRIPYFESNETFEGKLQLLGDSAIR